MQSRITNLLWKNLCLNGPLLEWKDRLLPYFIAGYSSPSSSTTSSPQQQVLQSAPSPVALRKRPVADDTDGHLAYLPGDILGDRYEIISTLGKNI